MPAAFNCFAFNCLRRLIASRSRLRVQRFNCCAFKGSIASRSRVQLPAAFKVLLLRVQLPAAFKAARSKVQLLRIQ
jgi:hypothetical protein